MTASSHYCVPHEGRGTGAEPWPPRPTPLSSQQHPFCSATPGHRAGSSPVNLATPSAGPRVPLSVRGRVTQHGTPPPVQGRVLVRVHVRTLQGRQNIAIQF